MGAMSAEITKPMPKPASKILGYGPGQIIVIIGKLIAAKITPMPCPTPKALETIGKQENIWQGHRNHGKPHRRPGRAEIRPQAASHV
jgi:hypothetical protein